MNDHKTSQQTVETHNSTRSNSADSLESSIFDPSSSPTCSIHAEDDWSIPEAPRIQEPKQRKIIKTFHRKCRCCSRSPKYCRHRKIQFRHKFTRTPYNLRLLKKLPSLPEDMEHKTQTKGNWTLVKPPETRNEKSTYKRKLILTVLQYHKF